MRIERSAGPAAAPAGQRAARGGFRLPDAAPEPAATRAATSVAAPTPGLVVLREDDRRRRDARARQRATALLDELALLQRALLNGSADPAALERLAALAEGEDAADPALAAILAAVALRARIELARREAGVTVNER